MTVRYPGPDLLAWPLMAMGLSDEEERGLGAGPSNPDTDGDTVTDGAEVHAHHTDPLQRDTDVDGLDEAAELNTHDTDATDPDTDGAGLSDGEEVSP